MRPARGWGGPGATPRPRAPQQSNNSEEELWRVHRGLGSAPLQLEALQGGSQGAPGAPLPEPGRPRTCPRAPSRPPPRTAATAGRGAHAPSPSPAAAMPRLRVLVGAETSCASRSGNQKGPGARGQPLIASTQRGRLQPVPAPGALHLQWLLGTHVYVPTVPWTTNLYRFL